MAAKPLRADALRNRTRILSAADAIFAELGPAASTEQVAQRANVAIGTVFRHFPTKEALLEAVFADRLHRLIAEAETLADTRDPGPAFFEFFDATVAATATKHAFTDALGEAGIDPAVLTGVMAEASRDLHRVMDRILTRAQQAGAVRADVNAPQLMALLIGAARIAEHTSTDPATRNTALAIVLDGLRPHSSVQSD